MLINTIILFIRDILPIGILLVWLLALYKPNNVSIKAISAYCTMSAILMLIIFLSAPRLSGFYDGAGFELVLASLVVIQFMLIIFGTTFGLNQQRFLQQGHITLLSGATIFTAVKGVSFLIYFSGYLSKSSQEMSIILAVVLGIGIIVSFSVLLFFVLQWLCQEQSRTLAKLCFGFFLAGQFSSIVPLLSQVDIVSEGVVLWNSEHIIQDGSEYGHIAKALFGYEATPSTSFIFFYIIGFVSYMGVLYWSTLTANTNNQIAGASK